MTTTKGILCVFCIFIDVFIWSTIIAEKPATTAKLDFLNVGQGDATLLQTTEGVLFLTDSGPNGQKTIRALSSVLPKTKNYIDILIISHPQLDHFGGFVEIIKQYKAGAVIYNGRDAETGNETWNQLLSEIEKKKIPLITVGKGDYIKTGKTNIQFISPDDELVQSAELNDTGLVEKINIEESFTALLTADIDAITEKILIKSNDLKTDILKIAHHGSRFASSNEFLKAVKPKIAIIEVGSENTYGHPNKETLENLKNAEIPVMRTDINGTIEIKNEKGNLVIFTQKDNK